MSELDYPIETKDLFQIMDDLVKEDNVSFEYLMEVFGFENTANYYNWAVDRLLDNYSET